MAEKTKETCLKKFGFEHWSKSNVGREFSSKLHLGRKCHLSRVQKCRYLLQNVLDLNEKLIRLLMADFVKTLGVTFEVIGKRIMLEFFSLKENIGCMNRQRFI